jgi:hypothetical protein
MPQRAGPPCPRRRTARSCSGDFNRLSRGRPLPNQILKEHYAPVPPPNHPSVPLRPREIVERRASLGLRGVPAELRIGITHHRVPYTPTEFVRADVSHARQQLLAPLQVADHLRFPVAPAPGGAGRHAPARPRGRRTRAGRTVGNGAACRARFLAPKVMTDRAVRPSTRFFGRRTSSGGTPHSPSRRLPQSVFKHATLRARARSTRAVIPRPGHAVAGFHTSGCRAEESTVGLLESRRGSPRCT